MKDFPLNDLLAATDLMKVQEGLLGIFLHLTKKLKVSYVFPLASPRLPYLDRTLFDERCRWWKPSRAT